MPVLATKFRFIAELEKEIVGKKNDEGKMNDVGNKNDLKLQKSNSVDWNQKLLLYSLLGVTILFSRT